MAVSTYALDVKQTPMAAPAYFSANGSGSLSGGDIR
jgi:hypothetical protein